MSSDTQSETAEAVAQPLPHEGTLRSAASTFPEGVDLSKFVSLGSSPELLAAFAYLAGMCPAPLGTDGTEYRQMCSRILEDAVRQSDIALAAFRAGHEIPAQVVSTFARRGIS